MKLGGLLLPNSICCTECLFIHLVYERREDLTASVLRTEMRPRAHIIFFSLHGPEKRFHDSFIILHNNSNELYLCILFMKSERVLRETCIVQKCDRGPILSCQFTLSRKRGFITGLLSYIITKMSYRN